MSKDVGSAGGIFPDLGQFFSYIFSPKNYLV